MPVNPGWPAPGQQLPPGYAYPYPYHLQPLPPQHLQPPPVYRGFYGPGNVWHPWGVDGQWQPQGPQAAGPAEQPNLDGAQAATQAPQPEASHGGPSLSQPAGQDPTPTTTRPQSTQDTASLAGPAAGSQSTPTTETAPSADGSLSVTAREAAALAALRRLGSTSQLPSTGPPSENQSPENATTSGSTAPATSESANESAPVASHAPTSGGPGSTPSGSVDSTISSSSTHQQQQPIADARPQVPPLIPLLDLANPQQLPALPPNPQALHYYQQQLAAQRFPYRVPAQPGQGHRSSGQPSGSQPRHRQQGPRAPLSQLPPTLTDEQLARLDRLTRDAIDERLRVLEGVSSAVFRCVEELTRIRSVLPAREEAGLAAQAAAASSAAEQSAPSATGSATVDRSAGAEPQGPQPPTTVTPKAGTRSNTSSAAQDGSSSSSSSSSSSDGAVQDRDEPISADLATTE